MSTSELDGARSLSSRDASASRPAPSKDQLLLTRLVDRVNRATIVVCGAGIVLMALHVMLDVTGRNAGAMLLSDTQAYVSLLWMPAICYLALGAAQIRREHMTVSLMVDSAGPRTRRVIEMVSDALVVVLLVWMTGLAVLAVPDSVELDERIGLTRWMVLWPSKLLVACGLALYCASTVATLIERIVNSTRYSRLLEKPHDGTASA